MSSDQTSFPITPADRIRRRQSSQQLLFDGRSPDGGSNAVVVYDYDQQALVAHSGASPPGRQQLQSPPRGRCPVCSSPLDPNGPSPAYFSSLQYWHNKLALPGHGSNPFSAPTAEDAVNDLRTVSYTHLTLPTKRIV